MTLGSMMKPMTRISAPQPDEVGPAAPQGCPLRRSGERRRQLTPADDPPARGKVWIEGRPEEVRPGGPDRLEAPGHHCRFPALEEALRRVLG